MAEYEYDYKQILREIEKYIFLAKEAAFEELANPNTRTRERAETFGKYSALVCISGRLDLLKIAHRREVKNESKLND